MNDLKKRYAETIKQQRIYGNEYSYGHRRDIGLLSDAMARIRELEQDAARYTYIRKNPFRAADILTSVSLEPADWGGETDAAIDEARKE